MSRQISPGVAHGYYTRSQRDPRDVQTVVAQATRKLCQGICVTGKPCSNPITHWRWSSGVRYCIHHQGQQPDESYEEGPVRREDEEYRHSPTKVHRDTVAHRHSPEAYKHTGEYRLSPAGVRRENERTFRTTKSVAQQDQDFFAQERLLFHHHFHHHGGQVKLRQVAPPPPRPTTRSHRQDHDEEELEHMDQHATPPPTRPHPTPRPPPPHLRSRPDHPQPEHHHHQSRRSPTIPHQPSPITTGSRRPYEHPRPAPSSPHLSQLPGGFPASPAQSLVDLDGGVGYPGTWSPRGQSGAAARLKEFVRMAEEEEARAVAERKKAAEVRKAAENKKARLAAEKKKKEEMAAEKKKKKEEEDQMARLAVEKSRVAASEEKADKAPATPTPTPPSYPTHAIPDFLLNIFKQTGLSTAEQLDRISKWQQDQAAALATKPSKPPPPVTPKRPTNKTPEKELDLPPAQRSPRSQEEAASSVFQPPSVRCTGLTSKGLRCQRTIMPGALDADADAAPLCWQHRPRWSGHEAAAVVEEEEEEEEMHAGFGESLMVSPTVPVAENPYAPPTVEDDDEEDELLALYSQLEGDGEEEEEEEVADQHSSSSSNNSSSPRCSGLTAKGEACRRTVAAPGGMCYQHRGQQQRPADDLAVDDSEPEGADSRRCSGITAKGERCQRAVDEAGGFCYQHRERAEEAEDGQRVDLRSAVEGEEGEPRSSTLRRKGKFTAHMLERIEEGEEAEAGEAGGAPARGGDTEMMSLFKARVEAAKEERGLRNRTPSSEMVARLRALAEDEKEESEPRRSARLSTFLAFSEAAAEEQ